MPAMVRPKASIVITKSQRKRRMSVHMKHSERKSTPMCWSSEIIASSRAQKASAPKARHLQGMVGGGEGKGW